MIRRPDLLLSWTRVDTAVLGAEGRAGACGPAVVRLPIMTVDLDEAGSLGGSKGLGVVFCDERAWPFREALVSGESDLGGTCARTLAAG